MNSTITVELPTEVKSVLDRAAREEGVSEDAFAAKALEDYLYLRRFRKLREKIAAESDRPYTDDEVFDIVS